MDADQFRCQPYIKNFDPFLSPLVYSMNPATAFNHFYKLFERKRARLSILLYRYFINYSTQRMCVAFSDDRGRGHPKVVPTL